MQRTSGVDIRSGNVERTLLSVALDLSCCSSGCLVRTTTSTLIGTLEKPPCDFDGSRSAKRRSSRSAAGWGQPGTGMPGTKSGINPSPTGTTEKRHERSATKSTPPFVTSDFAITPKSAHHGQGEGGIAP